MRKIVLPLLLGLGACALGLFATAPARANCYELIGCSDKDPYKISDLMQLGCQPLWEVRNWIFKKNGYCFRTAKAIKAFGNAGCRYDDFAQVPLNGIERHNVKAIRSVETRKGC